MNCLVRFLNWFILSIGDTVLKKIIAVIVATWFGAGFIPPIITKGFAGTWGTLLSIPFCYLLISITAGIPTRWRFVLYVLVAALVYVIGICTIPHASKAITPWIRRHRPKREQRKIAHDQYEIVIDETLGLVVSCWPLVVYTYVNPWIVLVAAFVLFRIFDGTKLYPASVFDQLQSAHGVMLDDFVAGLYTSLCLIILAYWL